MERVIREQAVIEVNKWLDTKKIFKSTREAREDDIELLIEAIQEGVLIYNEEDNSFTHKLLHPIMNEKSVTELKYLGRLNDNIIRPYLKGVDPSDGDARLLATLAALTGTAKGILSALDSVDKKVSNAITIFFF